MTDDEGPFRASPASERAYSLTKELVLSGELPAGHLFSEGVIAERLGVSRTPVREAFLRLQGEELLTLVPKRGAVVSPVPPGEAEDVLDAREAIEGAAVRRLLRRPEVLPELVATLQGLLVRQRECADQGRLEALAEADEAFHRAIVAAGGNRLTLRFYDGLADRQRRMSMHAIGPTPELIPVILQQHDDLVAILEESDEAAFRDALRAHLDGTHRR